MFSSADSVTLGSGPTAGKTFFYVRSIYKDVQTMGLAHAKSAITLFMADCANGTEAILGNSLFGIDGKLLFRIDGRDTPQPIAVEPQTSNALVFEVVCRIADRRAKAAAAAQQNSSPPGKP